MLRDRGADDKLIDRATASLTEVFAELQRDSGCHFAVRLPELLSYDDARYLQDDIASVMKLISRAVVC